ncbi:hypothetical protein FWF74_00465 [Candidatus Saccharibacteria bacterium]|nr:hypothetical protein [Candidatus Saccharibacteria bacterium]MCL1963320.1 hypothetical protein [Candidatus Saccharibacteria bacterium]
MGKTETEYSSERLHQSIARVAASNRTPLGTAEHFAREVVKKIENWIGNKSEITAAELRLQTAAVLADYDPETAYLYENEDKLF